MHIDPQKVLQTCPGKSGPTAEAAPGLNGVPSCVRADFLEEVKPEIVVDYFLSSMCL